MINMFVQKLPLQQDEILFLMNNFYSLTNQNLTDHINSLRSVKNQYTMSGLRHKCTNLGLSRSIQIRWSNQDIKRLKAWYKLIGDTEISKLLNLYGNSKKRINGVIVKRIFTIKHVEKKRRLLCLSRTKKQISEIRKDNKLCGNLKDFTSTDNLWTRGVKQIAKEEDIRTWKGRKHIKINGKFIPYTRWFYSKFISSVPKNMIVFHIDLDSLNDNIENLEIRKKKRLGINDYERALSLIKTRILNLKNKSSENWDNQKPKERQLAMSEIIRLENIKLKIESKFKKEEIKETGFYEHIEAF